MYRGSRSRWLGIAYLSPALLFVLVRWSPWRPETTSSPLRFQVQAPRITSALATGFDSERRLVLSPDGTRIVYQQSSSQSRIGLMLQRLDRRLVLVQMGNASAENCRCQGQPMPRLLSSRRTANGLATTTRAQGSCGRLPSREEARRPFARSRVQSPARAGQSMTSWCSQPVWNARASKQARA